MTPPAPQGFVWRTVATGQQVLMPQPAPTPVRGPITVGRSGGFSPGGISPGRTIVPGGFGPMPAPQPPRGIFPKGGPEGTPGSNQGPSPLPPIPDGGFPPVLPPGTSSGGDSGGGPLSQVPWWLWLLALAGGAYLLWKSDRKKNPARLRGHTDFVLEEDDEDDEAA